MDGDLCRIEFERKSDIFRTGESVSGEVHIHLSTPVITKGILVSCMGRSVVHFDDICVDIKDRQFVSLRKMSSLENVNYEFLPVRNEERYFEQYQYLFGNYSEIELKLDAGNHVYRFSFKLPSNLPNSFDGKYGRVEYVIRVTNRISPNDVIINRPFTVIAILHLIHNNSWFIDREVQVQRKLPYTCCRKQVIKIKLEINKTEFLLGECISYICKIENQSQMSLADIEIRLVQECTFLAGGCSRSSENIILKAILQGEVNRYEVKDWVGDTMEIPMNLPPTDFGCPVPNITLNYLISITLTIPGKKKRKDYTLCGEIPVLLEIVVEKDNATSTKAYSQGQLAEGQ